MRVYTLKCNCTNGLRLDPDDGEIVENVIIETRDCVTVSEMVDNFNKLLKVMGFCAEVDIVERAED